MPAPHRQDDFRWEGAVRVLWDLLLPLVALLILVVGWLPLIFHSEVGIVFRQTISLLFGVGWRSLLAAGLLAYALHAATPRLRLLLLTSLIAGAAFPLGTWTVAWKAAWQSPDSLAHSVCMWTGGFWSQTQPTDSASSGLGLMRGEAATIWVHSIAALPWLTLLFFGMTRLRHRGLEDLAAIEGRTWSIAAWQRWLTALCLAAAFLISNVVGEMTASDIFAVRTYAEEIYLGYPLGGGFAPQVPGPLNDVQPYRFPWTAHGWAIGSLVIALSLALSWSTRVGRNLQWEPVAVRDPRAAVQGLIIVVTIAWLSLMLVPVSYLIEQAGTQAVVVADETGEIRSQQQWSLERLLHRFGRTPWRLREELGYSLVIGACATLLALVAGQTLLSLFRTRFAWPLAALILTCCWGVPGPLLGVAALGLRSEAPQALVPLWDRSLFVPMVLLAIKLLPFATAGLGLIAWQTPRALRELARLEFHWPLIRLWRIQWAPHLFWHLGLSAGLMLLAVSDIGATNMVLPPGVDTLARRLLGMVHAGVDDQVAAITLEQMGLVFAMGLLIVAFDSRRARDLGMLQADVGRVQEPLKSK